jgi:hypothetical protein
MSSKQSYTIRFRVLVEDLSRKHEILDSDNKSKKRTYEDSFGNRDYEVERYGQEIDADFFKRNVGHATIG